jgi:hypothetical protein
VDSLVDIIPALKRVLDNLEKIQDEKGVPKSKEIVNKNITNSSLNNENTAELSGREVKKLRSVFTIFSEVFFEYQKKFAVDTKPKTLISTVAKPIEKQKEIILHLYHDKAYRDRLGKNARERVIERYTWRANAEKVLKLCEAALDRNRKY